MAARFRAWIEESYRAIAPKRVATAARPQMRPAAKPRAVRKAARKKAARKKPARKKPAR
jgi:hypothetical protein